MDGADRQREEKSTDQMREVDGERADGWTMNRVRVRVEEMQRRQEKETELSSSSISKYQRQQIYSRRSWQGVRALRWIMTEMCDVRVMKGRATQSSRAANILYMMWLMSLPCKENDRFETKKKAFSYMEYVTPVVSPICWWFVSVWWRAQRWGRA